uniref:Serpentine Receptor, class J n=1 Tax=Caenorhabditis tropicalis TaxID=1561998 RepID=A0A1I7U9F6_9PELO
MTYYFVKLNFSYHIRRDISDVYCFCFGFSMAIFAVHFIYRYGAVNRKFYRKYLSGYKEIYLYVFPVCSGSVYGFICWLFLWKDEDKNEYLRSTVMENYGLDIERCSYVSARFWLIDGNGNVYPDARMFFAILLAWIVLGASLFSVIYFGVRYYRWFLDLLKKQTSQSQFLKSLHNQLFHSLLVQCFLPLILMYIPAGIVFIFPMLNIHLNVNYGFIGLTTAIYPAIDPFPTIFIIKKYRESTWIIIQKCFFWNKIFHFLSVKKQKTVAPSTQSTSYF